MDRIAPVARELAVHGLLGIRNRSDDRCVILLRPVHGLSLERRPANLHAQGAGLCGSRLTMSALRGVGLFPGW